MTVKDYNDMVAIMRAGLVSGSGLKYRRLCETVVAGIESGRIAPGGKLPPHRWLSYQLGVTPGTISRAYAELERLGLVVARVGDGTFVRQGGVERQRDEGFRNADDEAATCLDMSRNMHIPAGDSDLLGRSLQALASDPQALDVLGGYAPEQGYLRHRQAGADWLSHGGFVADPARVICVNGGQHGLLCALMGLFRAGDTLVTECLTYPGLISAARMLGLRLVGLEMDEQGLLPAALDEACRAHRVAALYCTPTLQNPTAAVLDTARRQALVDVCRQHNLLILEDEADGVLVRERPLPLSDLAPERTVMLASLSKALSSGLRVGYLHAPQPLVSRLAAAVRATCWMATPLMQELAARWIEDGTAARLLTRQIDEVARRKALVVEQLAGLAYRTHARSPHFWIEVPAPWRASQIEHELRAGGYRIATAEAFAAGQGAVPQFIRASVCNQAADDGRLIDGFAALAGALKQGEGLLQG